MCPSPRVLKFGDTPPERARSRTIAPSRRLRLDVIMNAIGLIFLGLELPFQLVVCFHFSTAIYV